MLVEINEMPWKDERRRIKLQSQILYQVQRGYLI